MVRTARMDGLDALAQAVSQSTTSQLDPSFIDPSLRDNSNHTTIHQPVNIEDIINMPSFLNALAQEGVPPTPQQTRSGRISRPPLITRDVLTVLERLGAAGIGLVATPTIPDQGSSRHRRSGNGDWGYQQAVQEYDPPVRARSSVQHVSAPANHVMNVKGRKRSVSAIMETDDEEEEDQRPSERGREIPGLPAWPNPPGGRGGRKAMPAEEMLARRRARNKVAALESRKKKKEEVKGMQMSLKAREEACVTMEGRCRDLENEVIELKRIIVAAGLSLPSGSPLSNGSHGLATAPYVGRSTGQASAPVPPLTTTVPSYPAPALSSSLPIIPELSSVDFPSLATTAMDTPDFSLPFDTAAFSAFFDFPNENEDDDADFLPGSSPHAESDDEDRTPKTHHAGNKGKKRKINTRGRVDEDDEDDEEDEEFEDDDVEDEDLFLPIEDVEIPDGFKEKKAGKEDDAMKSLGVEDQGQFAELVERVVEAGKTKEVVTPDVLEKLKVLIGLAGRRGGTKG